MELIASYEFANLKDDDPKEFFESKNWMNDPTILFPSKS
jgi:hypothetical protein